MDRTSVACHRFGDLVDPQHVDVARLLQSKHLFEERRVFVILSDHTTCQLIEPDQVHHKARGTVKVEGMERYSLPLERSCVQLAANAGHLGPTTCHLFVTPVEGTTFALHSDPCDVILYVLSGEKDLTVDGVYYRLGPGDALFIPQGVEHVAINSSASVMLSYGLESYAIDRL